MSDNEVIARAAKVIEELTNGLAAYQRFVKSLDLTDEELDDLADDLILLGQQFVHQLRLRAPA
jgi:hypothetical protein